jgi:hypothetical protein
MTATTGSLFETQTECRFGEGGTSNERRGEDFGNFEGSGEARAPVLKPR